MRGWTIAIALLLLVLGIPPARAQERLLFAVISNQNAATLDRTWSPILSAMSKATGYDVAPLFFNDYAGAVWALSSNRAQIAWLGNRIAIEAVDHAECEVAMQAEQIDGSSGYHSLLIVRANAPFANVEDLLAHSKHLSFGFGDRNSTSGYLMPSYYLFAARGLNPKNLFHKLSFANHEANLDAVADGEVDAAVVGDGYLSSFKERDPERFARIKVLWTSPTIPSGPVVWRKDLPAAAKNAVRAFFLHYGKAAPSKSAEELASEKATLALLSAAGFHNSDNAQLTETRKIELYREKLELQNSAIEASLKKNRINAIDADLHRLEAH